MLKKSLLISSISLIALAFSLPVFAGEGSDTIGACKLQPELRYSYYEIPMYVEGNNNYVNFNGDPVDLDINAKEHTAAVNLTWGACDNLDLYTFVGARIASTIEDTADDVLVHSPIVTTDVKFVLDRGNSFTCGLGVRATFWRSDAGFYVGGGMSVAYAVTHGKKSLKYYEDGTLVNDSLDGRGVYYQEQNLAAVADLHAGWNFKNIGLTPYLGVEYRWNKAYVRVKNISGAAVDPDEITYRGQKPFGVYVGLDYRMKNGLYFNVESHMVNRWGGSASVGYVFDLCGAPVVPPVVPEPIIEPKLEPMSMK
jgi:hypothetical protein